MKYTESKTIPHVKIITLDVFTDHRGFYIESFNRKNCIDSGIEYNYQQDDFSISKLGVLRGIHGDHKTSKLVSCIHGMLQLVIVDPRTKQWESYDLYGPTRGSKYRQVFIPPGIGVGHLSKSTTAIFHYKQSTFYTGPESQFTIKYDDPAYRISWNLHREPILSKRDSEAPYES